MGDSGWAFFEIDGVEFGNEYTEILLDYMYDELDYGSWAGEFSAEGKAIYSSETKCFEGIDCCSDEVYVNYPCEIKIKVPKDFSFEEIIISFEESANVYVKTELEDCGSIIKEIKNDFLNQYYKVIQDFEDEGNTLLYSYLDEETFRKDYTLEGDFLTFTIKSISLTKEDLNEKDIVLSLKDIN